MREYIDKLVELHNTALELRRNDDISVCVDEWINVYTGFEKLAHEVQAPISIVEILTGEHLQFSFVYKGVKFITIRNRKEWEENKNAYLQ